jgi:hypothetical protein
MNALDVTLGNPYGRRTILVCALALCLGPHFETKALACKHSKHQVSQQSGEFTVLKSEPGTELRKEALGSFTLVSGTILVKVDHPVEIRVQDCLVKADKGASLLLTLNNKIGCVSDLTEKYDQVVDIVYGNRTLHLRSGRQVWFGHSETEITAAVREAPGQPKPLRKYETPAVGIIGEFLFSPATVIDSNDLILALKDSQFTPERELYADIVKTTAALSMVHP